MPRKQAMPPRAKRDGLPAGAVTKGKRPSALSRPAADVAPTAPGLERPDPARRAKRKRPIT